LAQSIVYPEGQPQQPQLPSVDFEIMEFMHDIPKEVPLKTRLMMFGYLNRILGLTMLDLHQTRSQIHKVHAQALFIQNSIPARLIDDGAINTIRQFEELCTLKIYQSQMRPRGWVNERVLTLYSVSEQILTGDKKSGERKHLLPIGPL
jgi:hypothetical protein